MRRFLLLFTLVFALLLSFIVPVGNAHAAGRPSGSGQTIKPFSVTSACDVNPQRDSADFIACAVEPYATPCLHVHTNAGPSAPIVACVNPRTILHLGCQVRSTSINGNNLWDSVEEYSGFVSDYYMATVNTANNQSPSMEICGGS